MTLDGGDVGLGVRSPTNSRTGAMAWYVVT
jgi:hypothetical protein